MWHQGVNCNFTKLCKYFLCAKKTKITTLFNNLSPRHPGAILESITYVKNVCTWIRCLRFDLNINNKSTLHMLFTYVILYKMVPGWWGDELLNKVNNFVFFAHKKYSRSFVKLHLNPWLQNGWLGSCYLPLFHCILGRYSEWELQS